MYFVKSDVIFFMVNTEKYLNLNHMKWLTEIFIVLIILLDIVKFIMMIILSYYPALHFML